MRVYEPTVVEGYQWVLPVDDADFEVFRTFSGDRCGSRWKTVPVRLLKSGEDGQPLRQADMPWLGSHAMVLGRRAVEVLGEVVAPDAELLPLACEDAELWLLNVWRVIDALDLEHSAVVRFPSTGRIMTVKRPVFRAEQLDGIRCFKIPGVLRGPTYVTEGVVAVAEAARLSGVRFRPVSDSE
jgi:hypothetical protein